MTYTDLDPPRHSGGHGPYHGPQGGRSHRYTADAGQRWSPGRSLRQLEAWLDERGKGAWIGAMVLGFVLFWPVGLAILFYMIWGKRMFKSCSSRRGTDESRWMNRRHGFRSSGNSAFDSYKADTLRRLEDEQEAFEGFLERLRAAKDKREFDEFMDERVARSRDEAARGDGADDAPLPGARPL